MHEKISIEGILIGGDYFKWGEETLGEKILILEGKY